MAERSFGSVLRNERERQGLSLEQATQGTRIRIQILEAFEDCDFENMPPKGYARNMIGSYARWLGLDPRKVVDLYLSNLETYDDENHDFANDPYSNYGHRSSGSRSSSGGRTSVRDRERPRRYQHGSSSRRQNSRGYMSSVDDRGRRKGSPQSLASEYTGTLSYTPTRGTPVDNIPSRNGHSPRATRIFASTSARRFLSGGRSRLIFFIAAAVIIFVIAALIASYVTSCSKSKDAVETPTVNTEAVQTATEEATQTGTTTTSAALAAPFTVTFSVAEGQATDATILVDGLEAYNGTAIGPLDQSYDVATAVEMTFTNPDVVTITLGDGTPVEIVKQEDGTGKVSLAVTGTTQAEAAPAEAAPEAAAPAEGEPVAEEVA